MNVGKNRATESSRLSNPRSVNANAVAAVNGFVNEASRNTVSIDVDLLDSRSA
jgi:hypothetical protein